MYNIRYNHIRTTTNHTHNQHTQQQHPVMSSTIVNANNKKKQKPQPSKPVVINNNSDDDEGDNNNRREGEDDEPNPLADAMSASVQQQSKKTKSTLAFNNNNNAINFDSDNSLSLFANRGQQQQNREYNDDPVGDEGEEQTPATQQYQSSSAATSASDSSSATTTTTTTKKSSRRRDEFDDALDRALGDSSTRSVVATSAGYIDPEDMKRIQKNQPQNKQKTKIIDDFEVSQIDTDKKKHLTKREKRKLKKEKQFGDDSSDNNNNNEASSATSTAASSSSSSSSIPPAIHHHQNLYNEYRVLTAAYDSEGIYVYQAYRPEIGLPAVENQNFLNNPYYSLTRMTWIKFSLGWMMYRCNYAQSKGQEVVLRIKLSYPALFAILNESTPSFWDDRIYSTEKEWNREMENSCVRYQWDPERDLHIQKFGHNQRALQIGMSKHIAAKYAGEEKGWIISIENVTSLVKQIKTCIDENKPLTPVLEEKEFVIEDEKLRKKLGMFGRKSDKQNNRHTENDASSSSSSSSSSASSSASSFSSSSSSSASATAVSSTSTSSPDFLCSSSTGAAPTSSSSSSSFSSSN